MLLDIKALHSTTKINLFNKKISFNFNHLKKINIKNTI